MASVPMTLRLRWVFQCGVENVLPCALAMMPKNRVETSMRQKTSSPLEKPKCVEAALTERFMTVKLSAAITTHAEPSGSFLMVSI
ncbi:Uncharacterised protein [Mycobacteroides abscessus subsp. massiliense]|nr:Uncharacterised protein [Mycobacteroides abscessus subsp. massiliense]